MVGYTHSPLPVNGWLVGDALFYKYRHPWQALDAVAFWFWFF